MINMIKKKDKIIFERSDFSCWREYERYKKGRPGMTFRLKNGMLMTIADPKRLFDKD